MKTNQHYLFTVGNDKRVGLHRLVLPDAQRPAEEQENSVVEKRKAQVYPDGRLLAWGCQRQDRNGVSYVISQGCVFGFLQLVLSQKQEQKLGQLSVIDSVLAIWGQLLQGLLFGFLDSYLKSILTSWISCCRLWVKVLTLYLVWPLSISIFSVSQPSLFIPKSLLLRTKPGSCKIKLFFFVVLFYKICLSTSVRATQENRNNTRYFKPGGCNRRN